MEKEKWSMAIWLSSTGFEGVQFFEASPKVRVRLLSILPKCSLLIEGVESLIRQMPDSREDLPDKGYPGDTGQSL